MPWEVRSVIDQRRELVVLCRSLSVSECARRFRVDRATVRKWRERHAAGGEAALLDLSRRPARSPARTSPEIERAVAALRREHPAWGGRKIAAVLAREGAGKVAPSTVTKILHRARLIDGARVPERATGSFARARPNDLWQMDYKGPVVT